jgi:hypothetical protein
MEMNEKRKKTRKMLEWAKRRAEDLRKCLQVSCTYLYTAGIIRAMSIKRLANVVQEVWPDYGVLLNKL